MNDAKAAMTNRPARRAAQRWMSDRGWWRHDNSLRGRVYHLTVRHHPWYDWGHRLMILVGTNDGGNYAEPSPPTWWYREAGINRMVRTHYPRPVLEVVTDFDKFRALSEGANEDEMYRWQAICVNADGELILGHRYWGGTFYGMRKSEIYLLRRYLRVWHRHDWWGLRSWLYSQALHAAVNLRRPFACNATPPRDTGGYSHWHCQLPRRHPGQDHKFNSYIWPGGDAKVEYKPQ